jgi:hypothetical protein
MDSAFLFAHLPVRVMGRLRAVQVLGRLRSDRVLQLPTPVLDAYCSLTVPGVNQTGDPGQRLTFW